MASASVLTKSSGPARFELAIELVAGQGGRSAVTQDQAGHLDRAGQPLRIMDRAGPHAQLNRDQRDLRLGEMIQRQAVLKSEVIDHGRRKPHGVEIQTETGLSRAHRRLCLWRRLGGGIVLGLSPPGAMLTGQRSGQHQAPHQGG